VSEVKHVRNCNLSYTVHYFYIDAEFRDGERINNLHKNDVHMNTGGRVFSREIYNAQYGGGGFGSGPDTQEEEALTVPLVEGVEAQYVITDEYDSGKRLHGQTRAAQLSCRSAHDTVLVGLSISLYELILEKKYAMQEVFSVLDPRGEGVVTKTQFSMVLHDVLKVPVQWIRLLQVLLEEPHFKMHRGKRLIDYAAFLNQFLELTTVPKGDVEAEEETDPNLDALGRYLKAMEKTAHSVSAAQETKKQAETVNAIRTSSASAIDVSHHLRNISQFDKFSAQPTAGSRSAKDDLGKPFVPSQQTASRELKPLEAPPKPPVYVSAGNRGRTASGSLEPASLSAKHAPPAFPPFISPGEEKKEGEEEEEEEEGNSYHNYLVTEGLLDVLYTDFIRLEQTFQFFDRDKKGYFTLADLTRGFDELRLVMPPTALLPSAEEVMRVLDVHASGEVDMNLFFEMHRICDMSIKAHIDDDDSVDETSKPPEYVMSRDQSMDNLARRMSIGGTAMLNAQQMQVLQQAQISPNSPTHHHATGVRNDSNASLAIKGVNINVDELTTFNTASNVESRAESRKVAAAAATGLDI
jgi:Ca2+-binding EF-hand superfamily protein